MKVIVGEEVINGLEKAPAQPAADRERSRLNGASWFHDHHGVLGLDHHDVLKEIGQCRAPS